MGPDIHAVVIHVYGYITDDPDPLLVAVSFESKPLTEEEVLQELLMLDGIVEVFFDGLQGIRLPITDFRGPLIPCLAVKVGLECDKEGEVLKPGDVLGTKIFVFVMILLGNL